MDENEDASAAEGETVEVSVPVPDSDDGSTVVDAGDTTVIVEATPEPIPTPVVPDVDRGGIHPDVAAFMADTRVRFEELSAEIGDVRGTAIGAADTATQAADFIDEAISSVDEAADDIANTMADIQPATSASSDVPPVNTPKWFRKRGDKR